MSQNDQYSLTELLAGLPPEPAEATLFPQIQKKVFESGRKLVVIDDDPTGVQTVHDVALFAAWDEATLAQALENEPKLFFILTNSRSMSAEAATEINRRIARQLSAASKTTGISFAVDSRSDSTLRGHYPEEVQALESTLGDCDGHLIVPAFFEGGRFTINDTHYVATPTANSDSLIRADQTPFAQDKVFGYKTSFLPSWIEEKSQGYWKAAQVGTLSLELIRNGGPEAVADYLRRVEGGRPVIVNAAGYGDMAVVVLGLLEAEAHGKRFLYRTGAGFVRLRGAVERKPLLSASEMLSENPYSKNGGLVVVGSYVPGSSAQLEKLLQVTNVSAIELEVARVIRNPEEAQKASREAGQALQAAIARGATGVIYTSRKLVTGESDLENLSIGRKVTESLLNVLREVTSPPRFIIAKGGITSHEIAVTALGAEKARALGQILPGVPVWRLESGSQLRFKGVPYIVFPGNVGGPDSLVEAAQKLLR